MNGIYKSIEDYKPNKRRKILIVFDDMISDMLSDKKRNPIVTELYIRGKKNLIFLLRLLHNLIFMCHKVLD